MGLTDIRNQFFFYFVSIQDFISLVSSLYAVHFQLFQSLGVIKALHGINISYKGPLCVIQHINFTIVRWTRGPQRGAVVQTWSYEGIPDRFHWFRFSSSKGPMLDDT